MTKTLAELQARRDDLMRRLDAGDDKCFAHDPLYGNGPEAWTALWMGYLDEYLAVEEAIKWHTAQPPLGEVVMGPGDWRRATVQTRLDISEGVR